MQEVAFNAVAEANALHNDCMENHFTNADSLPNLRVEESIGESNKRGISEDLSFDPQVLEDVIKPLYRGSESTNTNTMW
jgi:hypothetical protein